MLAMIDQKRAVSDVLEIASRVVFRERRACKPLCERLRDPFERAQNVWLKPGALICSSLNKSKIMIWFNLLSRLSMKGFYPAAFGAIWLMSIRLIDDQKHAHVYRRRLEEPRIRSKQRGDARMTYHQAINYANGAFASPSLLATL